MKLSVLTGNLAQGCIAAKAGADFIYMPGQWFRPNRPATGEEVCHWAEQIDGIGRKAYFTLPRIYHDEDSPFYRKLLSSLKDSKIRGV